jgi:hypothetical protein
MRMMLKILIPVEHGNRAAKDGSMQKAFDNLFEMLQPEQTYFMMEDGMRCALLFYELKENYHLVDIHEPLLASMGAKIYDVPALTYADLKKGFATLQS